jgi:SnoaL-like domain
MGDRNEILEVLARYARALEERDGRAVAALFAPDGEFTLFGRYGSDDYVYAGVHVVGRDNIRAMIEIDSIPPGRGMHYLTSDHIVEISGDEASMNAQFVAVESNADLRSESSWGTAAGIVHGTLALTMIGRYDSRLRRTDGRWVFTTHRVKHSLPIALLSKK